MRSSPFTFPAGRVAKFVVIGIWLLLAAVSVPLAGKYADAEENESTSFLPSDAESTKALEISERLQDGEKAPTVIVYRRDGGLEPADRARIADDTAKLNAATRAFANTSPFGEPQVSRDGTTALIGNQLTATGEPEGIIDPVDRYREITTERAPPGLDVAVTGAAGVSADAIKVFENINGTLLGAALLLVIVLLILIYRSPFFWFFPILAVIFAEICSRGLGYGLTEIGVTVNGQSSSIASVLVIGAGTDYALLLVARYREELRRHADKHDAMRIALASAGPAIFASGLTVMLTLLSLTLAKVEGTAGLGPNGAAAVLVAMLASLTLLPALLLVVGRKPFWPRIPHHGDTTAAGETQGSWRRLADRVGRSPRRVWVGTTLLLAVMCLGLLNFNTNLTQGNSFRDSVESIEGQDLIAEAFPRGQSVPTDLVVPAGADQQQVLRAAAGVDEVDQVTPQPVAQDAEYRQYAVVLAEDPYSTRAFAIVPKLRDAVQRVDDGVLVGGATAVEHDLRDASERDTLLLIPIALVIVFLILVVLLRAVVAPILLVLTVVLSFAAALGVGAIVFDVVFGFPGSDASIPLFAFIFLVSLGVDYNIFLMARVREETLVHGTAEGMKRGVAVTGGVITSAGIVLAGTFAVLGVLPITFLTEIGFVVAFGVLLDTFLVRSVLVPALVLEAGPKVWWPSHLAKDDRGRPGEHGIGGGMPMEQQVPAARVD